MKKLALVTGGARGIGRAAALDLATRGWDLALCYRTSEADARETAAELEKHGATVLAERCDVSDPSQVDAFVSRVNGRFGRIDAVINCAGPYHRAKLLEETNAGWRAMFQNNLDSVFFMARAVAPGMIERKSGRIIAFSMAGADRVQANTTVTAHFIAKLGVSTLCKALAKELGPHNVTVNTIAPGFIDSKSAPADELEKMKKNIPAGYVGNVDDVVGAIRYLLSDEARYITGTTINVSGGWGL